jgi:hypothetical protein
MNNNLNIFRALAVGGSIFALASASAAFADATPQCNDGPPALSTEW